MTVNQPSLDQAFQTLRQVRSVMLSLHKTLMDSEKLAYEQQFGTIQSKGQYLQLVMGDPWFSWLREYSQFIVKVDESFSPKQQFTLEQAMTLLSEAKQLLSESADGSDREKKYHGAIQRDPAIAKMHGELMTLINQVS